MTTSQTQSMFHKERISLKFDMKIPIRNKIPNPYTLKVDTTLLEQRTFRNPVPTFWGPDLTIDCVSQS